MAISPQIQQLIASKQAANNYLALTLLQTQVGLSFDLAFAHLLLISEEESSIYNVSKYRLPILEYQIYYTVEHKWTHQHDYPFLEIRRYIQKNDKRIKGYDMYWSIDFFESEQERDIYEALIGIPTLGNGLEVLFQVEK